MFGLAWTKFAHLGAALVTSTVLVHGGRPYTPKLYTSWLAKFYVPSPPGYVDFGIGSCASHDELGCMEWTSPIATVRIIRSDRLDRFTFAHEMGHVFDYYVLSRTGGRDRFATLEGFPWTTPRSEEYFADSYAVCALHTVLRRPVTTDYGFRVTPSLHRRICSLIRSSYAQWEASQSVGSIGQTLPPGGATLSAQIHD
jgi:hypothetical protein